MVKFAIGLGLIAWQSAGLFRIYRPSSLYDHFFCIKNSVELANADSASYAMASSGLCR